MPKNLYLNNAKVSKLFYKGVQAKKTYYNGVLIYSSGEFSFNYTGAYELSGSLEENFVIKFKTSGTLTIEKIDGFDSGFDVFLVGGGGGGSGCEANGIEAGGGGGYTLTKKKISLSNTTYKIEIGAGGLGGEGKPLGGGSGWHTAGYDGSPTKAFGLTTNGGSGGTSFGGNGGSGGGAPGSYDGQYDGGNGGRDGNNGKTNVVNGSATSGIGNGQGKTTREFSEPSGKLYSGGGGGSTKRLDNRYGGKGYDGAGSGLPLASSQIFNATENSGGGGGGASGLPGGGTDGGKGGTGIVCLRNGRG